jgi:hypothetical protein
MKSRLIRHHLCLSSLVGRTWTAMAGAAALALGCSAGIDETHVAFDSQEPSEATDETRPDAPPEVVGDRLMFVDAESFYATVDRAARMSEAELVEWEAQFEFPSYGLYLQEVSRDDAAELSETDEEFANFPPGYLAVLNRKGEVQIGDDIVWYHRGARHHVPSDDPALLQAIQLDPTKSLRQGTYSLTPIEVPREVDAAPGPRLLTTELNVLGALDARYQDEFDYLGSSGARRKHVYELFVFTDGALNFYDPFFGPCYRYHSTLYLRIKLEWYGSRSHRWKPAGEERLIEYDIQTTSNITNIHLPPFLVTSQSSPEVIQHLTGSETRTSDLYVPIHDVDAMQFTVTGQGNPRFKVGVTGSLYQHITDDLQSNEWSVVGTTSDPLW